MSYAHDFLREVDWSDPANAVLFAVEQLIKGLYTAMPGIVEEYDAAARRAKVKPALRRYKSDETFVSRETIVNVPVLSQSNGRVVSSVSLEAGDAVLLLWSMRGIGNFLKTHEEADPVLSSLMSATDAIALPGFGPAPDVTYVPTYDEGHGLAGGWTIQSADGAVHASLDENCVRLRAGGDTQVDVAEESVRLRIGTATEVVLSPTQVLLKGAAVAVEVSGSSYAFNPATGHFGSGHPIG